MLWGRGRRPSSRAGDALRLIVFDFDQTLSVFHVFKTLAGWTAGEHPGEAAPFGVPAPYAASEIGQMRRVEDLDRGPFREAGGFARAAFGGEPRVLEVRGFLQELRGADVELIVCTKGLVGVVSKCLQDLDMLRHFSQVYGNVGSNYGMMPFDQEVAAAPDLRAEAHALIGTDKQANWGTKDRLIQTLMESRGLRPPQCVLVEDDPQEIKNAEPVCRTLFVPEAQGITTEHMAALLRMAREGGAGKGPRVPGRARNNEGGRPRLVWRVKPTTPGVAGTPMCVDPPGDL